MIFFIFEFDFIINIQKKLRAEKLATFHQQTQKFWSEHVLLKVFWIPSNWQSHWCFWVPICWGTINFHAFLLTVTISCTQARQISLFDSIMKDSPRNSVKTRVVSRYRTLRNTMRKISLFCVKIPNHQMLTLKCTKKGTRHSSSKPW
jgi:hypothetical protein